MTHAIFDFKAINERLKRIAVNDRVELIKESTAKTLPPLKSADPGHSHSFTCRGCGGAGSVPGPRGSHSKTVTCPICNGSGRA